MNDERRDALSGLAHRLGHAFRDLALLDRALTHASHANEALDPGVADNESLEFLGDAVLGFAITDILHRLDPDGAEGEKSRRRAQLVSAANLSRRAAELGLPELLRLGKGEEKTGGREKTALWADAYEAVVAALFLDGGIGPAQRFVAADFAADLAAGEAAQGDAKSVLQERLQAAGRPLPVYAVIAEEGPSHRRRFRVECRLEDGSTTVGEDFSKKAAEQLAAGLALARLEERRG